MILKNHKKFVLLFNKYHNNYINNNKLINNNFNKN